MLAGGSYIGALNLYRDRPGPLSDDQHADALLLAVDSTVEVSVPDTLDPPESLGEDCPPHAANTTTLADKTAPSTRCREEKREDNTLRASRNV